MTTNKLFVAFACLGLVTTASAEVNFDKGIDVKSVIEQAGKTDSTKGFYPQPGDTHSVRFSRDCKSFSFGASAYPISSQRVSLESTEYIEECHFVPAPPPVNPPNNGGDHGGQPGNHGGPGGDHGGQPGNHGGPGGDHGGPGGHHKDFTETKGFDGPHPDHSYNDQNGQNGNWQCHERPGRTLRNSAQLNIAQRQLFPWESESFNVCMEGDRVDFNTGSSPYSYGVDRVGMYDLTFNLTPNYRVATAPDSNGMSLASFSFKDGKFTLNVNDMWAAEYAGEQVAIKVDLVKDGFLFFNSDKGSKTFTMDAAGNYTLVFAEGDMQKNKDFMDDSADKGPSKYFVKWGFQRLGKVSTNNYVDKGKTDKIPV